MGRGAAAGRSSARSPAPAPFVDKRWAQSTSQSAYLLGMSEVARSMTPEALAVGPGVIHSQFNKFGQPVPEGALRPPSTEPPTGMYLSGMQTAFTEAADARAAENDPRNLSMEPNVIVSDFAKFGMPIPPEHLQPPPKMSPRSAADTYTSMNQLSGKIARDAVAHAMTAAGLSAGPGVIHSKFNKFGQPVPLEAIKPPPSKQPPSTYLSTMQAGYLEAEAARLNMASKEGLRMGPNTIVSDFTPYGKAIPPGALQPPPQMTKEELVDKYTSINQQAVQAGRDAVAFAMTREGLAAPPGTIHSKFNKFGQSVPEGALKMADRTAPPDMYRSTSSLGFAEAQDGMQEYMDARRAVPSGTIHSNFRQY